MAVSHVYNQTVADGTATSVVRPSDWNSVHNQFLTVSGNTAGQSTMSGTNIVFQGGNNVTLSVATAAGAATVVYSAANQTNQTVASGNIAGTGFTSTSTAGAAIVGTNNTAGLSLGIPNYLTTSPAQTNQTAGIYGSSQTFGQSSSSTYDARSLSVVGSGGVSVGWSAGSFLISGQTTAAQTVQTQASGNIPRSGFTTNATAGVVLVGTHDTAGLNLGVPAWLTTAAQTSASNVSQIVAATNNAGAGTATLSGAVLFSNANNMTFYTSAGNAIVGSFSTSQSVQTQPAGNIAGVGTTFGGTNVSGSMTMNSNGLVLSLSAPTPGGGGAINVSAGTTSNNLQTIVFSNSNGMSFGLNGSTVTASAAGGGGGFTGSWFQPEVWGSMLSTTLANGTVYFRPVEFDTPYDADMVLLQQSISSQGSSTLSFSASVSAGNASSGTGSWGQTITALWFSRVATNETAASYGSIVTFDSKTYSLGQAYSASVSWSTNASSATATVTTSWGVSYIENIDGAGGVTTSSTGASGSTSFSSTSTNANSFSSSFVLSGPYQHVSGIRPVFIPQAGSAMPAGEYWLGLVQSVNTGSTNMSLQRPISYVSQGMVCFTGSAQNSYLEYGASANMSTSNYRPGFGSYSASSNTTGNIALTQISLMASNESIWFAVAGKTL